MERQKQAWEFDEDEEVEEEVGLLGRQSRHTNVYTNGRAIENGDAPAEEAEKHEEETNKELSNNVINNEAVADENGVELLKNSVYFDSHQENESGHGLSGMTYFADESYVLEIDPKDEELHKAEEFDIQRILSTEITHQQGENLEDEIFSGLSSTPVQSSCEERSMNLEHLDNKTGVDADVDIIEEIDQELTEIDVERVLQKQNTHDLYCPNCNSCITRRVILRRKRRKVRNMRHRIKRDKFETRAVAEANPLYAANDQDPDPFNSSNDAPTHAAADDNHGRQPDIFRCLSCFSIFIPTGNGFKLFRVFGDSNKNGKIQDVQGIPASKKNWFFSIFASENRKAAIDQGNRAPEHSEVNGINQHNSSCYSENTPFCNGNNHPVEQVDDRNSVETRALEKDSIIKSQEGVSESLNHSKVESLLLGKPVMAIEHKTNVATENKALDDHNDLELPTQVASSPIKSPSTLGLGPANSASIASEEAGQAIVNSSPKEPISYNSVTIDVGEKSTQVASSPIKSPTNVGPVNCASVYSQEAGKGTVNSSTKDSIPYDSVSSDMREKLGDTVVKKNTGDDVIVVIERQPVEPSSSLRVQDIDTSVQAGILPQSGTQIHVGQHQGAAASEGHQWDILKSIVYGGLVESITSLGVVSSAAGAGAATLNILALGLANLIGGLFIIGHNLRELRNERSGETSTRMTEQEDRYKQLLGRRDKFSLHATVVVLSFLIFGLVPPVVYGFSFRNSGNRDLKIAAVAGSSLACIILLAVGKGHVQKPTKSYIRTVFYYVCLGFMSSGVSYVVGDLIKKLLEKLNLSVLTIDANISYDFYPMNSGWASY